MSQVSEHRAVLPPDHGERMLLAEEVHARPMQALATPARATHIAVLIAHEDRARELQHVVALCEHYGAAVPGQQTLHHSVELDELVFRWERHGEFSSYSFYAPELPAEPDAVAGSPFDPSPVARLPPGWLAGIPGTTLVAAQARLITAVAADAESDLLAAHFAGNPVVGAEVGGGGGFVFTDFKVQADGFTRFLILDRQFTLRQAGRTLQRLFEIETYRMMALLALPIARRVLPRLLAIETALVSLTREIARPGANDESILNELTPLAAEVESELTGSQTRFGACRAYNDLVSTRVAELRERRIPGMQTIEEFMARRFRPAVATVASTAQRLRALAERIAQVSTLLSTRVDIARESQNQQLLEAMNRRAETQFRLQQAIEGLSLAAIVYYGVGLVGYGAKALRQAGVPVDPELAEGWAIPAVALLCLVAIGLARRRIARHAHGAPAGR